MARQLVRTSLVLGVALAAAISPARAQEPKQSAPKTRTIRVTECVPEKVLEKRTVCRTECRQETYDTVRCEKVPVVKERVCNVVTKVPVMTMETRKVCVPVWTCEDRVVNKPCWETRQVTCMQKKCVCKGYWEDREVETFLSKLGGHLHKDCCDDCDPRCPKTRCKKCWVNCPKYEDVPVTKCQKVCVMKQETCKVKVCHTEVREVQVQKCSYRCETTQRVEKYCTWETRQVPVKATRTVRVPVQTVEDVWVTRMVQREREVQVAECCDSCDSCAPRCGLGLRARLRGGDCCH